MDAENNISLSQSEHPASFLPVSRHCDWPKGTEVESYSETDRQREREREKKEEQLCPSLLLLTLSFSFVLCLCLAHLSLLLLRLNRLSVIPEDIQRFNTMDLLPTDCCLPHSIMGAGVPSALQERS